MEVSIHCGILTRRWWVACRRFVARSSREKNFRGVPWRSPEDERHGVSCRSFGGSTSEREGVSFKLEIASSAAMMGRKLGAKLNARREECKREREREREREQEALSNETRRQIIYWFLFTSRRLLGFEQLSWKTRIGIIFASRFPRVILREEVDFDRLCIVQFLVWNIRKILI